MLVGAQSELGRGTRIRLSASGVGSSTTPDSRHVAFRMNPARLSTEALQTPARVNVTCVTPLGEEVASIS